MNKGGGMGVGSASIVLVFAALCLTVFSLITLVVASNDKALTDAEAQLVRDYYAADELAERVLVELINSNYIPDSVFDIEIDGWYDWMEDAEYVYYRTPISDKKELLVHLAIYMDGYDVLIWRMCDTDEWSFDDSLNVWGGDDGFGLWLGEGDVFAMLTIDD